MTHPLTDKICEDLVLRFYWSARSSYSDRLKGLVSKEVDTADNMRTAADWQLEQVKLTGKCLINELHENNSHIGADHAAAFLEVLIKAMRPTTKEDNS